MAKRSTHTVGLDIGTSRGTCIVAAPGEDGVLSVIGTGESDSRGLRKGVIVNPEAAVESIRRAVEEAERMSGVQAQEVTINLAGSHIMGFNGQAIVAVASRDHEITGERWAVKVHIVTSPVTARQNAINAVNRAGLIVTDMVLEQLAAAEATLTEDDKEYGAALVDIGAETTGLCVYQRGAVQHTAVFPLGGSHFTNDIAFGLRTPIPEAEKIKRTFGCASSTSLSDAMRGEMVEVPSVGGRAPRQLSRQILCDILQPRAEEVLMHVADELKDSNWTRQLSSGVVLTGGGALLDGIIEVAEQVFDAPVRIGYPERDRFGGLVEDIKSPAWAAAAGRALVSHRAHAIEQRAMAAKRGSSGRLTHFVSKFRDRFSSSNF